MAYATTLAEGETFTTVEEDRHAPVQDGELIAEGYVVNSGRTWASWTATSGTKPGG
jgi:acyl-coenzyme A thioesterase PaaI-like protein